MASLMEDVARKALNRRPAVAAYVFGQNGFDYGFFGDSFSGLG